MNIIECFSKVDDVVPRCQKNTCVIILTLALTFNACSGGGGPGPSHEGPQGTPGISGRACLDDVANPTTYQIEVDGVQPLRMEMATSPIPGIYRGNIGGQIRAVTTQNFAVPGQEANNLLVWGVGASIRYGNAQEALGTAVLGKPGAVMDLAPIRIDGVPMLVYATENGLGLIGVSESGRLEDVAYRPVSMGVLSVDADDAGDRVAFVTGSGYMHVTSADKLASSEACVEILSGYRVFEDSGQNYAPAKVELGESYAFAMAHHSRAASSVAPTFEHVYDPLFISMISDVPAEIVRAVNLEDHKVFSASFSASDGSFDRFDRFIPTDIALGDGNLYVVGIAYKRSSVEAFLVSECSAQDMSAQVACMREKARDGTMTMFRDGGTFAFSAGFFVYRNVDDLSQADHFEYIPLAAFRHDQDAPPFVYRIEAEGDRVFVRGPNFLVAMAKSTTVFGSERWSFEMEVDAASGLIAGIPNDIVPYAGGAAASFTAVMASDGTGASALEVMSDGSFSILDTGSTLARFEGGNANNIAVIEIATSRGGELYLEGQGSRKHIADFDYANAYVSTAAYDGDMLAFAWSSTGTETTPETQQGWRLAVQRGADAASRGQIFIDRMSASPDDPFYGFPEIRSTDILPGLVRGINDIMLYPSDRKIAVMFSGFRNDKWYYQLGLYEYPPTSRFLPQKVGVMKAIGTAARLTSHGGRIQRITASGGGYEIIFSTADGIHSVTIVPGREEPAASARIYSAGGLVDAAIDSAGGGKIAIVDGGNVVIADITDPQLRISVPRTEGMDSGGLAGARVALTGSALAVACPYNAAAPFSFYRVGQNSAELVSSCSGCYFLSVASHSLLPGYLMASSLSSGIEFYELR